MPDYFFYIVMWMKTYFNLHFISTKIQLKWIFVVSELAICYANSKRSWHFNVVLMLYAFCCDVTFYGWVFWVSAKINFVLFADDTLWVEILVLRDFLCRFFSFSLKKTLQFIDLELSNNRWAWRSRDLLTGAHPEFSIVEWGVDPEAIYKICIWF
jgi:hypothetical protein